MEESNESLGMVARFAALSPAHGGAYFEMEAALDNIGGQKFALVRGSVVKIGQYAANPCIFPLLLCPKSEKAAMHTRILPLRISL